MGGGPKFEGRNGQDGVEKKVRSTPGSTYHQPRLRREPKGGLETKTNSREAVAFPENMNIQGRDGDTKGGESR